MSTEFIMEQDLSLKNAAKNSQFWFPYRQEKYSIKHFAINLGLLGCFGIAMIFYFYCGYTYQAAITDGVLILDRIMLINQMAILFCVYFLTVIWVFNGIWRFFMLMPFMGLLFFNSPFEQWYLAVSTVIFMVYWMYCVISPKSEIVKG